MKHLALAALAALLLATPATADPDRWRAEWPNTDFTTTSIDDWSEIISGGPPRDGIPALDDPSFHPVAEEQDLAPLEPVIAVELEGATPRAYPIRYLTWHEIVNDEIDGRPVAVTFCPLCNSALTFDRRTDAGVLTFGVSGKLRSSDMVMFDRETESWWQQALGRGIVGDLTGTELQSLPSWMESWGSFAARNPDGLVMSQPTGHRRNYGANPYVRYDSARQPFLYRGEEPPHGIPPLVRVVRVGERAWPLSRLMEEGEIREAGIVLSLAGTQASALDTSRIGEGREIGSVRVRDATGADVPHDVMFAFAFHAFWPEGAWMLGG
ncbi:hypothetical protein OG2516_01361 [Oceanicola granulosus HTCC2516]|uniref:DUF3179 domain-containing protein n=1 Tax=Oceanicola granulosus (strain ATCC BAA-861 / DSM 15982 / KCTC 12143 / HTCC2516) TaxID=314256 RepID=Q2CG17_OCEGH|nr:DUF3179 domain-containing protein [Oceanicola granulosus]EAR51525.1 hypothetical protein OG2516_01361 [Oceanicola granulosus HTCC2516]